MIRWNEKWVPICGRFFSDNDEGVNLFCQKLGFEGGSFTEKRMSSSEDSFYIGKCNAGDVWANCRGKCNEYKIGGGCTKSEGHTSDTCGAGDSVKMKITCNGWNAVERMSCGSKNRQLRFDNLIDVRFQL